MKYTPEMVDAMMAAEEEPPVGDSPVVSAAELGEWLGIAPNRIHALGRDGILPRVEGTRYPLRAAVVAYCDHARALARGKQVDAELAAEKLRLAKANAEKVETANAKLRGELIPAAEVEREWAAVLRGVRAAMLAVPSRVAQTAGHLTPHDINAIDREVRDALEEAAHD
ncbi:DNA packaging protein [Sagittula sp. MA-2]|jgi:phage terminase Nu1 subunit (DNA packaging protein)|uniref:DNA packaging protein n=1 Tax=Sagittula sp. MA-2 TaxID=3048007 RepID=UPI0024C459D1|nr:DNA packaging protein [Sagittula sp. MA-2]WHZ36630.1 DNA packaging protein [Sagittula sp. MA-2]